LAGFGLRTIAAAGLALTASGASAATTCVANASNISFGSLGVGALVGATSSGTIYEGCSGGWATRGNLATCNSIGAGANSVSQTARTMTSGAFSIGYNLYVDSGYATPYADPGSDTFYIPYSTASGGYTTTTTYAKILSAANVAPGVYVDTYSTTTQSWIDFDTWNTTYPPIVCGPNALYTSVSPTFTVSVTVLASCSIAVGNLNFGSVSVLTANTDATAGLSVTCTNTTPYTVSLGAGSGAGATVTRRLMTGSGAATVAYGLYQDSARSIVWGSTPPPAAVANTVSGAGTGSAQALTIYGRVPPQTTPAQGTYNDTVLVTLTY